MRKSLGEKRKEIGAEHIAEITRLYGAFEEGERVKILPNESFGFQRITVERPLRLRYEVTEATLPAIEAAAGWAKLDRRRPGRRSPTGFAGSTGSARPTGPKPPARSARCRRRSRRPSGTPSPSAIPEAPVIIDRKGHPEPDPDLRDNENVPLPGPVDGFDDDPTDRLASRPYRDAVDTYVAAEVHPYVPDAWVDHAKTKIGYEIPLTRQFYRYVPPRPLEEIDAEIRALEEEIQRLLREVTA